MEKAAHVFIKEAARLQLDNKKLDKLLPKDISDRDREKIKDLIIEYYAPLQRVKAKGSLRTLFGIALGAPLGPAGMLAGGLIGKATTGGMAEKAMDAFEDRLRNLGYRFDRFTGKIYRY